ncbi:hypothetical protein VTK73DRAFT_7890 [Phialemonium thermophilum]|uniref:Alginate lyase domain-containing protein n=1 Tax=Phialemonium thermophilum TaxID=223376 RepID=A0ABR3XS41_9PEZI
MWVCKASTTRVGVVIIALASWLAAATVTGPPTLNGPVFPVPSFPGMKTRMGDFVHPGLWHTHDDLERIRAGVEKGEEPWKSAYADFSTDSFSQAGYAMQGPKSVLCRGPCSNYTSFSNDVRAAYQNALMWYITRDQGHWDRATTILDAWGTNLTNIVGTDASLLVGLEGDLFANAAEIMRWEGGWVEAGAKASGGSGFSNQLYWLFARHIKALLSFAVYLDDVAMYNYALYSYLNDLCAGLYGNFDPATGQGAETGRDQGHAMGALGWTAEAARTVQSQGVDLYALENNLLLRAAEYTAKYNLGHDVPYDPKFYRCEAVLINGPWSAPSNISRGVSTGIPKVWDILYYQYVVKRGLCAPYTIQIKHALDALGGEGHPTGSSPGDHPSWGDLIWSYPGKGDFLNDNNRTIWGGGSIGPGGLGNLNSA